MTAEDIQDAFAGGPALVPYIVAGDPSPDRTADYVRALVRGGAHVVELGLPFSEPIADGPTIQGGIRRALDAGMTPRRYFDLVSGLDVEIPIVSMTYYNLVYRYGDGDVEPFVADAADAGISGLIVPDLPVEESQTLKEACTRHDIALIFIVAPTTTEARIRRIVEQASGFLYVQARLGTTGARDDVSDSTFETLSRLPETDLPLSVGFGVRTGEHARAIVSGGADGVIAGSVFVDIIEDGDQVEKRLEETAGELATGLRAGRPEPDQP
ncbi:MAG: tryptophan synthase subunit alpha [Halodesulfurarchaeum sp.]